MEYFIGALVSLATVLIVIRLLRNNLSEPGVEIRYRQSHVFELIKDFIPYEVYKPFKHTQATKFIEESTIKIIFFENQAYWISSNTLYTADAMNGEIDQESTRQVDTMDMDKVQLDKTMFIVEKL